MDLAQALPLLTTALTVFGSVIVALARPDSAPREVRLLTRLAEATAHVSVETPGGRALDDALAEVAAAYAEKARIRRTRKVNGNTVAALIIVGLAAAAVVYGLSVFAVWIGTFGVVFAVLGWVVVAAAVVLTIALLAAGSMTIYNPPKPKSSDHS